MKLVIPLPYDSRQWKPREVIKMLGEFAKIDVNNVVWQLGSGKWAMFLSETK